MEDYRYTRLERRRGYFILHFDDEVKNKKTFLDYILFRKPKTNKEKKYLIFNKDRSQFNTVNDITVAHVFKHDEAIRLRRRTPIKDLNLSMVKMTKDNQFILV
jgi:hypothetical protein